MTVLRRGGKRSRGWLSACAFCWVKIKCALLDYGWVCCRTLLSVGRLCWLPVAAAAAAAPPPPPPAPASFSKFSPNTLSPRSLLNRGTAAACVDCYFIASAWSVTGQNRNCLLLFAVKISFQRASPNTTIYTPFT